MTPKKNDHGQRIPAGGAGHATMLAIFLGLLVVHLVVASFFISSNATGTDAAWSGFPLDDAWIHMVYSRSLAETGVPCYNDGEPENGFTSPLWMIAGAVPQLLDRLTGVSAVSGVKVMGLLFGWLAACAMTSLLLGAGGKLQSAVFGGVLVAASPVMVFASLSGMEVTLTAFVMLSAFGAFRGRAYLGAGIFAALAVLARPECVLLFGLLPVVYLMAGRGRGKEAAGTVRGDLLRLVVPGSVVMALWAIWSLSVAGRLLPNTFYAKKQDGDYLDPTEFFDVIREALEKIPFWAAVAMGVLVLAGLARIVTLGRGESVRNSAKRAAAGKDASRAVASLFGLVLVMFGVGFVFAICASREMSEGSTDYYYWWRYLVPAVPFMFVPVAFGLDWLSRTGLGRGARNGAIAVGIVAALLACSGMLANVKATAAHFAWNCQNINEVQVELGQWINNKLPPDATIAVNDAGATRYFGHRKTIDLLCLNRHQGLAEMEQGTAFPMIRLPEKVKWLVDNEIDYLVVFPSWFPDIAFAAMQNRAVRAGGPRSITCSFLVHQERRSDHFTIIEAPPPGKIGQNVKRVYQCIYR